MNLLPPLSLALVDLAVAVPAGSDLFRAQTAFAHGAGYRAVQLNAAAPGLRPRELDRSARRDLAAFLRRHELGISGVDLWIPPEHFADTAQVDRAVAAALAAIEFATDIDRLMVGAVTATTAGDGRAVCLSLPSGVNEAVVAALREKAIACAARVADFGGGVTPGTIVEGVIGPGYDPAAALLAGASVNAAGTVKLPAGLIAARLTDANTFGRVAPGASGGRLDVLAYGM
jgi:hypothetical protein